MAKLVRKAELAERLGVTPARVSQWLSAGKISDGAIVGTGRYALIDEEIARAQLDARLDRVQREAQAAPVNTLVPLPLDDRATTAIGCAASRLADGALAFIASRLAARLGITAKDALRELRKGWADYCEPSK